MGKLVEGLWDCPFYDNKRIRAGQKTCPNCGHPQDESTKFYMPDAVEYVPEEKEEKRSHKCVSRRTGLCYKYIHRVDTI